MRHGIYFSPSSGEGDRGWAAIERALEGLEVVTSFTTLHESSKTSPTICISYHSGIPPEHVIDPEGEKLTWHCPVPGLRHLVQCRLGCQSCNPGQIANTPVSVAAIVNGATAVRGKHLADDV